MSNEVFVTYVKNLRLGEVKALIAQLEDELGVSASPVVSRVDVPVPPPEPDKTEFDVVLEAYADTKVKLEAIKVVRKTTGLGLRDAKALVESAPVAVRTGVDEATATALADALRGIGAEVAVT